MTEPGIRLWHQSITDLERLPGYASMLAEHAAAVCDAGTVVDLHGVLPGTYPPGVAPIEMGRYPWATALRVLQIAENALKAEKQGYDAVAISCFIDPALEQARALVDIPVVGALETALLVASTVGRSFGLIALDAHMAQTLRQLVARYGFSERVRVVAALEPALTEHELDHAFKGSSDFVDRFTAQARTLIAQGVDVIIPAEGVLNTALVRNDVHKIDGIPVLDSYGAVLSYAEMLVRMQRRCKLSTGRGHAYRRAPDAVVDHLREITISALVAARPASVAAQPAPSKNKELP